MQKTFAQKDIPHVAKELLDILSHARPEQSATVVALSGELGAGKTTLTQAIARELGIVERLVSPTFVIMKLYPIVGHAWKQLVHIDAYRLNTTEELRKLGWTTLLSDPDNLILIEWPEKVPEAVPERATQVKLAHAGDDTRVVTVTF